MNKSDRLLSLDAFRGFTMAAMVLVNNPGSWEHIYPQLEHAQWNGWTFTDWIFPFFLWIVGMSVTYSLSSRKHKGDTKQKLVLQIFRRTAVLFSIGVFLNGFPFGLLFGSQFNISTIRIPGVLQRIAICYCCASLFFLSLNKKNIGIIVVILLSVYWMFMKLIPIPDGETGILEAGKNFAAYIDSLILSGHMWRNTLTWDPEGIVSTLPAIATTLFGVLTGEYLRTSQHSKIEKGNWMFVIGSGLLLLGAILDMWLPINKSLWTSSYAIFMAGWAMVIFSLFYFLLDVKNITWWSYPFVVYGSNAITAYVISSLQETLVYGISTTVVSSLGVIHSISVKEYVMTYFSRYFSLHTASLIYGLLTVGAIYCLLWIMWKKKIFIKI